MARECRGVSSKPNRRIALSVARWPAPRAGRNSRSGRPHRRREFRISTDHRIGRIRPRGGFGAPDHPARRERETLWGCGAGFRARKPVASQGRPSAKIRGSLFSVWIRDKAVERRSRGSSRNETAADRSRRMLRRRVAYRQPQRSLLEGRGAGGGARRSARSRSRSGDPFRSETPFVGGAGPSGCRRGRILTPRVRCSPSRNV